jgi:hypothetical protein
MAPLVISWERVQQGQVMWRENIPWGLVNYEVTYNISVLTAEDVMDNVILHGPLVARGRRVLLSLIRHMATLVHSTLLQLHAELVGIPHLRDYVYLGFPKAVWDPDSLDSPAPADTWTLSWRRFGVFRRSRLEVGADLVFKRGLGLVVQLLGLRLSGLDGWNGVSEQLLSLGQRVLKYRVSLWGDFVQRFCGEAEDILDWA